MRVPEGIIVGVKLLMYITENLQSLTLYQKKKNSKSYFYTFLHILNSTFFCSYSIPYPIYLCFEFTSNSSFCEYYFVICAFIFSVIISEYLLDC